MTEYIKREALVSNLELLARHEDKFRQSVILGVVDTIRAMEAADAVLVVRCENCAFSQSDGWVCGGTALMPPHQTFPDSFCECGAKMDGGGNDAKSV